MQQALDAAEDEEAGVYEDGNEDSGGHRGAVFGVLLAADEVRVVGLEEDADHGQDEDGEGGDDGARASRNFGQSMIATT